MKFEKFVKSLASTGTIYERENGERWLASQTVFMLIPPTVKSVTARSIDKMPENVEKIISQFGHADAADLVAAYMPVPDGGIKDCVREYASRDRDVRCLIANDDYSLIEKSDLPAIQSTYNLDTDKQEPKALLIKNYPIVPEEGDMLVGIIFPIGYVPQILDLKE